MLTDYGTLDPAQRNLLLLFFCDPHIRARQPEWESVAHFVVAAFRADAARSRCLEERRIASFAVDGRPDLGLAIYNLATPADADRIRGLLAPPSPV